MKTSFPKLTNLNGFTFDGKVFVRDSILYIAGLITAPESIPSANMAVLLIDGLEEARTVSGLGKCNRQETLEQHSLCLNNYGSLWVYDLVALGKYEINELIILDKSIS